jgi:hypothetical protein
LAAGPASLADLAALKEWIDAGAKECICGRLPDHVHRPGPVAERVDKGVAAGEGGGGGVTESCGRPRAACPALKP